MVALGGYGRSELAPGSDVDLLFLVEHQDPSGPAFVEAVLYGLWDLGVEVGHATRTLDETRQAAAEEHSVLTALLDARLLPEGAGPERGRRTAFAALLETVDRLLGTQRVASRFIEAKLEELRQRKESFEDTIFLLEPNVKESAGGLRDMHAARWISRARFGAHGLDELAALGVVSSDERFALERAEAFMLRVRYELHVSASRRQDSLRFIHQERLAETLGYFQAGETDFDKKRSGVERFMRAYYHHAHELRRLSRAVIDRAVRSPPVEGESRIIDGKLRAFGGMLGLTRVDAFVEDPSLLVRIFEVAESEGSTIHPYARHLIWETRMLLDARWRRSRAVVDPFLALLEDPQHVGQHLMDMYELGVLTQLIPELRRISARWQHSLYHVYTVDLHVLRVLGHAKRLRRGDLRAEHPHLTRLAQDIPRPNVLFLACLLHDIGKGWPKEDHSLRGEKVARAVGARLEAAQTPAWSPEDTRDLAWLVKEHLAMSTISQRRDISDPALVACFAREVETEERLSMLYLLTVADMMGTSPTVWNGWKASLLSDFYTYVRAELRRDEGPSVKQRLEERRARVTEALCARVEPEAVADATAFGAAVPNSYLLATTALAMERHFEMWSSARGGGGLSLHVGHLVRDGWSRLTVVSVDRPGGLARVAGVLASHGLSILSATAFTLDVSEEGAREAPVALGLFDVVDAGGQPCTDAERWAVVIEGLEQALKAPLDAPIEQSIFERPGLGRRHRPKVRTKVEVVREPGQDAVLDVFCEDHVGVLWLIAQTLSAHGLTIRLAKVSTQGHRAADGFYLWDAIEGTAVNDEPRLEQAAHAIRDALGRFGPLAEKA